MDLDLFETKFSAEVSLRSLFVELLTSLILAAVVRINKEQDDAIWVIAW